MTSSGSGNGEGGSERWGWSGEGRGDIYLELSSACLLLVDFYSITTFFFSVTELIETMKKVIEPSIWYVLETQLRC